MRLRLIVAAVALLGLTLPAAPAVAQPVAPTVSQRLTTLTWHECPQELAQWRCATLTVPRDWFTREDVRTVDVELAVREATRDRIGALTFHPGGPGGSGLEAAKRTYDRLPGQVKARFDFVAWDPRGVGDSTPQLKNCVVHRSGYEAPAVGPVDWTAYATHWSEVTAESLGPCWSANANLAPYLGTDYVVEDLEAMRKALSYEEWNIWGMSYGSRIAYRYARAYPEHVRAMVLDGALPPSQTIADWAATEAWAMTYAQANFGSLFGARLALRLARILDELNSRTVMIDGRTMDRWTIATRIFGQISSQAAYPDIIAVVNAVYRALFHEATPLQQRRAARALDRLHVEDDSGRRLSINMITCADLGEPPSLSEVASIAQSAYLNNSVAASRVSSVKGTLCAGLPMPIGRPYPEPTEPLQLRHPPVVVNALGDARTPWSGARDLADAISGSSFITYVGTQHVTYLETTSACINKRITDYLLRLRKPGSLTCDFAPLRAE